MTIARVIDKTQDTVNFELLFSAEDEHFWFRVRNQIIETLARQMAPFFPSDCRILEIGCGTGNALRVLERAYPEGTVVGMDLFARGLRYARRRGLLNVVQGDARAPPFWPKFHMICLFDILEHLSDDLYMLRELHTMLSHHGRLMLTVPAHHSLWSYVDEISSHHRRYEPEALQERLQQVGFRVEYLTQFMTIILPVLFLRRIRGRISKWDGFETNVGEMRELAYGELRVPHFLNRLLTFVLSQETRLIARRKQIPFGTSLLAVACTDE